MGRKYDSILVTIDQGPGQVPHGDQGSGRGSVGECQLGDNDQFFNKTGTKSVNFCPNSAIRKFLTLDMLSSKTKKMANCQ